jgi:uncharacterized protein DUF2442
MGSVKSVSVGAERLRVTLADGRIIQTPLSWYPTLLRATKTQLKKSKPCGAGRGIFWPLLDYHLSIEGLLRGAREAEGIYRRLAEA